MQVVTRTMSWLLLTVVRSTRCQLKMLMCVGRDAWPRHACQCDSAELTCQTSGGTKGLVSCWVRAAKLLAVVQQQWLLLLRMLMCSIHVTVPVAAFVWVWWLWWWFMLALLVAVQYNGWLMRNNLLSQGCCIILQSNCTSLCFLVEYCSVHSEEAFCFCGAGQRSGLWKLAWAIVGLGGLQLVARRTRAWNGFHMFSHIVSSASSGIFWNHVISYTHTHTHTHTDTAIREMQLCSSRSTFGNHKSFNIKSFRLSVKYGRLRWIYHHGDMVRIAPW